MIEKGFSSFVKMKSCLIFILIPTLYFYFYFIPRSTHIDEQHFIGEQTILQKKQITVSIHRSVVSA